MSSLAAAGADGFYHPPEYDPRKHGGLSKFAGSKGANQYQKKGVIRFELPYNSWCLGCKRTLGQGTRYNAKKEKAGNYFSTTIWQFSMKCHQCDQPIIVKTDPANSDYEFVEGLKRIESMPTPESAETIALQSDETKLRLESDGLFYIENQELDKSIAKKQNKHIKQLMHLSQKTTKDTFKLNRELRRKARGDRKYIQQLKQDGQRAGLPFALVPEDESSIEVAKQVIGARVQKPSGNLLLSKEQHKETQHDVEGLGGGLKLKRTSSDVEEVVVVRKKKKRKKSKR